MALVHGTNDLATQIAKLPGIHFVFPIHDGSMQNPFKPTPEAGFVVGAGQKGKSVTRLDLGVGGTGAYVDAGAATRAFKELSYIQKRLADAQGRLAKAGTAEKPALERVVTQLRARYEELAKQAQAGVDATKPFMQHQIVNLGRDVPDEPKLAARVKKYEAKHPPSADPHAGHGH